MTTFGIVNVDGGGGRGGGGGGGGGGGRETGGGGGGMEHWTPSGIWKVLPDVLGDNWKK